MYDGFGSAASTLVYNVGTTTNNHVFYAATSSTARTELFRVAGTGVVSIPATGSLSLGTPLAPASGGTGLNAVGTAGYYLASNGTTMNWVPPSAGTGSVTSVSLAVAGALTGLFTNTGSGTITTTGAFTLTQASNPTITLGTGNTFSVSKPVGSTLVPTFQINGGIGAEIFVMDVLAPVDIDSQAKCRIGRDISAGNFAELNFYYLDSNNAANTFTIGLNGGSSLLFTKTNGVVTGYPFRATTITSTAGISTTTITASGLVSANAGISTTTITASGLVSANAGISTTTVTASGLVSANAGLSATSTTTNGINLSSNITEGIRITSSAASLNAVTLGCYATGVPDSTPIQFGFANTTGDQAKLNFSYTSANSPLNFMTLQMGAAIFKMSNSTSTASTLNTPLTVTGLVTGTNLSATSFTASRVASIDASKNLISTDQALLKLAASNTDYSLLGSSSPDGSTNTRIVVSGNSRVGFAGEITYIATGATGSHIWWTGGATQKMKLDVDGNLTVSGTIRSSALYGRRFKAGDQGITTGATSWQYVNFNDAVFGLLTSDGTNYTNNTGGTLVVQVNTAICWDPYFAGGWAASRLLLSTGSVYGNSSTFLSPGTLSMSTVSAIFSLANTQSFALQAVHDRTVTMSIKGNVDGTSEICSMSYTVLN